MTQNKSVPPLVITDLDGTLLDYRTRSLPPAFPALLDRILASGCAFAAASGRQPSAVLDLFPDHADKIWVISDNGAALSKAGKTIFERIIPDDVVKRVCDDALRIDPCVDLVLVGHNANYIRDWPDKNEAGFRKYYSPLVVSPDPYGASQGDPVRKIIISRADHRDIPEVQALMKRFEPEISSVAAEPGWYDFMPFGVDKGYAVRELQRLLGVDPAECVCFGDWENDVSMLASCGRSYAMRGGHPSAIAAAKFLAPSCEDQGELSVLSEIFA